MELSQPPSSGSTVTSWKDSFDASERTRKQIKRFAEFHTVDWLHESLLENKNYYDAIHSKVQYHGSFQDRLKTFTAKFVVSIQSWIVLTIMGVCIGLIAAAINILTEWLGNFKTGYCKTNFYLNQEFCCWGEEEDCESWQRWSDHAILRYLIFIFISVTFGTIAALLCRAYAPSAAGSGISEVKCIVSGFVMDGFLGWWTLIIKSIALPLVISSGLSVGKEGPSVHYAACVGNVIPKLFKRFGRSYSSLSQFLTAGSAAGVAVAFASPIGGVLFSIEEITSNFKLSTLWKSYYCALVATGTLSAMNPFRTGQIVMFEVKYESSWKYFEIPFFMILGVFGGVYGIVVAKLNIKVVAFRQKYLSNHAIREVVLLCLFTSAIGYFNEFSRLEMSEGMQILFHECGGEFDHSLCKIEKNVGLRFKFFVSLIYATLLRVFLVVISYGCKVPCGIFVPSMAAGATFGRAVGLLVETLNPCTGANEGTCTISGTYAFLGAAAALSGITHLTLTVVVIMFELTGANRYIIPTMIVVGVTKIINDKWGIGFGGIADQMIKFNGIPFLDPKEEHDFEDHKITDCMADQVVTLPATGATYKDLEQVLAETPFQTYPIVAEDGTTVLGLVKRTDLLLGLNHHKHKRNMVIPLDTPVCFVSQTRADDESDMLKLETYVDHQYYRININSSFNTLLNIFMKLGPKLVVVEDFGKLSGIICRKDLIMFELHLHQHKHEDIFVTDSDEKLFALVWKFANWIHDKAFALVHRKRQPIVVLDLDE
ncbi:hypothetical protein OGAPHI_002812 [Ogataea philodendri]|uniref:Chloride channel protein n=1 Tax=Ogataea philodendri TaxID=1378263 RepID=A0A9P8P7G1_9ASCO|nr:uncharacterized protein OGAPHI_002812 [Ogataea philodendri]KAH3667163.1 hypothetical protein OGAPHI_002812 [Ogataea philodendri]